ncbi:c-type cytochrome [Cellvibrio mixtus]|uniref:c-type cytochrome n=1 Tax=Cellvibrio mixtus TaxID=39650 RepID=UPI0006933B47|nr:c-type cytochrome [Cellvibrio mixtus]
MAILKSQALLRGNPGGSLCGARFCIRIVLLCCSLLLSQAILAGEFSGNAAEGKAKATDERCAECHGLDGNIHAFNESAKIPKLAGQSPDYLLKQFQDFRSGERKNDFMAIMARNLDDADVVDILAWYASQPVMTGNHEASAQGEKLFLEGDAKRGIVACASCHGRDGKGTREPVKGYPDLPPELIPVVGGQDWHYLDQQLRDWRAGERTNSQDGVMNKVTRNLTDAEINALNDFISALK